MIRRLSLLSELRKGGYAASLITTFNAYLPFYEEVVLRRLINSGVRHNVLLMDAQQYGVSLRNHPPRVAGRWYTLSPIAVPGAFHPKLILLVGKHKGLVIIGSHNMTIAGFGFNRELTNAIHIQAEGDPTGIAIATRVWSEVLRWVYSSSHTVPRQILDMVVQLEDFAPWLNTQDPETGSEVRLLAGRASGPTLWVQLRRLLSSPVKEIFLTGAFFDSNLDFLRQINSDLRPEQTVVAVDPATVEIPSDSRGIANVRFVRASSFGTDNEKDTDIARGYLHAKGMFLRLQNNDCLFVSGSANPSRPAWLAGQDDGNTELVIARLGFGAQKAANELGFMEIPNLPPLEDHDWTSIANNSFQEDGATNSGPKVGVAVVLEDEVHIIANITSGLEGATLSLMDADNHEITRGDGLIKRDNQYIATFDRNHLSQANFLRCILDDHIAANLVLHHVRIVKEQARTGVQKQFGDALLSLQTASPNIDLLIECISKIIFSDDVTQASSLPVHASSVASMNRDGNSVTDTLMIDVSDVRQKKIKHKLIHNNDLGYVLDTLIFHLRFQEDRTMETVDRLGRSEEERIGADDSEDASEALLTEVDRVELLKVCHTKVQKVVRRMINQLSSLVEGKRSMDSVLLRLLAVLAVLRELRRCDGRVLWVDQGKTTVLHEERLRLFEEVMFSLFEGDTSLLHLESLGSELAISEEIARLKGLLLWLAWDCGLSFNPVKSLSFMESPEKEAMRLKTNAMLLALAQSIQEDGRVIDEAQLSIGIFTTGDMDWLHAVRSLAKQSDAAKRGELAVRSADEAEPGDVAIHRNLPSWDLRVVAGEPTDLVSLIKLSRTEEWVHYRREVLMTTRLQPNRSESSSN